MSIGRARTDVPAAGRSCSTRPPIDNSGSARAHLLRCARQRPNRCWRSVAAQLRRTIKDLEGLREDLGIDRFGILGHSLGGHTAYLYASRHPQRVESLILVDVGPPLTEELARGLWRAMQAQRTADDEAGLQRIGASAAFQAREPKAVETYILNIYAPFFRDRRTIEALDLGFTEVTAANVVDYEDRLVATLPEQDPLDRLSKISCPTLVIHGEVDPMPLEFSRLLADRIPGAQLAVISGGNHFPFIEDRDAFMVVVREFLGKLTRIWTMQDDQVIINFSGADNDPFTVEGDRLVFAGPAGPEGTWTCTKAN